MIITSRTYVIYLLFFLIFLFSFSSAIAQTKIDTAVASQYYQKADSLLTVKKHQESITLLEKALPIYQKAKVWEKVANCYNKISENQLHTGQLEAAYKTAKKALKTSQGYLPKDHLVMAQILESIAKYHIRKYQTDEAISKLHEAIRIKKLALPNNHRDMILPYSQLAWSYFSEAKNKKAIEYYKKAIDFSLEVHGPEHPDLTNIYVNAARVYTSSGKLDQAKRLFEKALNIWRKKHGENHVDVGMSYLNLATIYQRQFQLDKALEVGEKAISILEDTDDFYKLCIAYLNIGIIHYNKGAYDKSISYYKKGLGTANRLKRNNYLIMHAYNAMVNTYLDMERYQMALEFSEKTLALIETNKVDADTEMRIYRVIGLTYLRLKKYDTAIKYLEKGYDVYKKSQGQDVTEMVPLIVIVMAEVYEEQGDYEKALSFLKESLNLTKIYLGEEHPNITDLHRYLSRVYLKSNNYEKALYHSNKALKLIPNHTEEVAKDKIEMNISSDPKSQLRILKWKASALVSLSEKEGNPTYIKEGLSIYDKMDRIIDFTRRSFKSHEDKISFNKIPNGIYRDAIDAHFKAYQKSKASQHLERLFYFMEKSKSNTLHELLTDAKEFSGLSSELLDAEKTLKIDYAYYQSQITNELSNAPMDSLKVRQFENALFDINRKQDSLVQVLKKKHSNYYQLKHNDNLISVTETQRQLPKQGSLVSFFTTDSLTYAYTITSKQLHFKALPTPNLKKHIKDLRSALQTKDLLNYKKEAYQLYVMLIQPIRDQFVGNELIIIPDGPLWHLNFDLLLSSESTSQDFGDLPYFLRDYAMTYANSAELLFNSFKGEQDIKVDQDCLAFSFTNEETIAEGVSQNIGLAALRDTGDDLPGTRKEIRAIADIIEGQYYFGAEANEANFKKNAGHYKILHLALHGEVNNEKPENSKLFFTKSKDTIEDNLLYAHELFALNIPSELTVLSACNTGTGKIAKGEGIMSLGNAFQYTGTKSLLLSSWEVPDDTAPELMRYFYTNLKAGMNKAKALQQAKLNYLEIADRYHKAPFYWGGFYLVGDSSPIQFSTTNFWYWIFGFGVLGMILLGLFLYKKKTEI